MSDMENKDMENMLIDLFSEHDIAVCSYEAAKLKTLNNGVVVEMDDGSEFQLTIVKSK